MKFIVTTHDGKENKIDADSFTVVSGALVFYSGNADSWLKDSILAFAPGQWRHVYNRGEYEEMA